MITNALNCKYSSTELFEAIPTFTDIKEDLWTYHFIGIAEQLGWLNNTTGYFRPDDTLTRSEAVHMLITVLH
jgi:hypothetical protein